jgi:hypothetical protein
MEIKKKVFIDTYTKKMDKLLTQCQSKKIILNVIIALTSLLAFVASFFLK